MLGTIDLRLGLLVHRIMQYPGYVYLRIITYALDCRACEPEPEINKSSFSISYLSLLALLHQPAYYVCSLGLNDLISSIGTLGIGPTICVWVVVMVEMFMILYCNC